MQQRKLVLYIAMSMDGYIAKPGDDLSFLSVVQQEGEDYGYSDFIKTVDTVIMGRKTFDWVTKEIQGHPHPDKDTYIITHTAKPQTGRTIFYTGNLKTLVEELKNKEGKNIYCDGGAEVVNELMRQQLIDEYIVSIIPIMLGGGVRLFKDGRPEQNLHLIKTKSFSSGLVQLHYSA